MLDEVEELDLMLSHYVISWAAKPPKDSQQEGTWNSWGLHKRGTEASQTNAKGESQTNAKDASTP